LTRDTPRGRHPTAARSPPEGDRAVAVAARSRAEARSRVAEPAVLATPESAAGPAVSDRWTPEGSASLRRAEPLRRAALPADSRRGDRRHPVLAAPKDRPKDSCSASPEGVAVRLRAPPEGFVRRAAWRTEVRSLARPGSRRNPGYRPNRGVYVFTGRNGAAGPKSDPTAEAAGPSRSSRDPCTEVRGA
jgi:hypothetical protein